MPFGGALLASSAISGGSSLLGGLLGKNAAGGAANAYTRNAQQGIGAIQGAVGNLTNAANSGQQNVSNAAGLAAGGVSQAAGAAASGVSQGAGQANSLLGGLYGAQVGNLNPYLGAGGVGANALQAALSPGGSLMGQFTPPDPNQVANTPEYQFQLQQGLQALQRSSAATGGLQGGGTQKAITQYGQGLASTSYQQSYNNAANAFSLNRQSTLGSLGLGVNAGLGAAGQFGQANAQYGGLASPNITNAAQYGGNAAINAAQYGGNAAQSAAQLGAGYGLQAAQTGVNAAGQIANIYGNIGNAQASGILGQNNYLQSGLSGAANAGNQYNWGNYLGNSGYSFGQGIPGVSSSNISMPTFTTPQATPPFLGYGQ